MSHPNLLGRRPESFTSFFSVPSQPPQTTCTTKPERASLMEIRYRSSATSSGWQSDWPTPSFSQMKDQEKMQKYFNDWPLKNTARRIVLKERNLWFTPTESCESEETEAEDVKPFRALSRLARSSSRRGEGSRADAWVPDRRDREGGWDHPHPRYKQMKETRPFKGVVSGKSSGDLSDQNAPLNPELERGHEERQSNKQRGGIFPRGSWSKSRSRTSVRSWQARSSNSTSTRRPVSSFCFTNTLFSPMVRKSRKRSRARQSTSRLARNTCLSSRGSGGCLSMGTAQTHPSPRTWATRWRRDATLQSNCWASSGKSHGQRCRHHCERLEHLGPPWTRKGKGEPDRRNMGRNAFDSSTGLVSNVRPDLRTQTIVVAPFWQQGIVLVWFMCVRVSVSVFLVSVNVGVKCGGKCVVLCCVCCVVWWRTSASVNERAVFKSKSMTLTNFVGCHFADPSSRVMFRTIFAWTPDGSHWIQSACVAIQRSSLKWSSLYVSGALSGTGRWYAVSEIEDPVNDGALVLIETYTRVPWLSARKGKNKAGKKEGGQGRQP